MVRISNTFYQVTEDARSVQVCADLTNRFSTEADCPVNFPVRMRLVSSDDTAGKKHQLAVMTCVLLLYPQDG